MRREACVPRPSPRPGSNQVYTLHFAICILQFSISENWRREPGARGLEPSRLADNFQFGVRQDELGRPGRIEELDGCGAARARVIVAQPATAGHVEEQVGTATEASDVGQRDAMLAVVGRTDRPRQVGEAQLAQRGDEIA